MEREHTDSEAFSGVLSAMVDEIKEDIE